MDNTEKLRIMLQHWIEHNKGHVEEFEKWRGLMSEEGNASVASHITKAIEMMGSVNTILTNALADVGGVQTSAEVSHDHHHHHHHHDDDDHHHHHHHDDDDHHHHHHHDDDDHHHHHHHDDDDHHHHH